jgi:hypothetical protein
MVLQNLSWPAPFLKIWCRSPDLCGSKKNLLERWKTAQRVLYAEQLCHYPARLKLADCLAGAGNGKSRGKVGVTIDGKRKG